MKNIVQPQKNLVALSLQNKGPNILEVLAELGGNETAREAIIRALKQIEKNAKLPLNRSIREELTGPMADALFKNAGSLRKELKDGTLFDFVYRSKIARDIILSPDQKPDHVFEPQTTKLFLNLAR